MTTCVQTHHTPWCDPRQHISEGDSSGAGAACVSGAIEVGRFGGWLVAAVGDEPKIVLDKMSHRLDGEYTKDEALEIISEHVELAAYLTKAVTEMSRTA